MGPSSSPPYNAEIFYCKDKALLFIFHRNLISNICISNSSSLVGAVFPRPSPPTLNFTFHPFLLMFCCVLVKSQLATVSRSLAALTMASGIMLNTAPGLLSPSTSISDALWSTQEKDGGLSMKMSLQLHKHISQTPSVSALPPLAHPPPILTFKKFLCDSLLKCSFTSRSSFIMHGHFEFA